MKVNELATEMIKKAADICKDNDLESAGIIMVKGKQLVVVMTSHEPMTPERRTEVTKYIGKYMTKMGDGMDSGEIKPELIDADNPYFTPEPTDEQRFFPN